MIMKIHFVYILSCSLIILFSCRQTDKKNKSTNDIYIPEYAIKKPIYSNLISKELDDKLAKSHKNIQSKFKKGFLEDNFDDESDVYGHPDYDYGSLIVWNTPKYPREEIYFNAKKINKEYIFYYENNKLICVLEGKYDDDAVFHGDSLFFHNKEIFLWKNTKNLFVNDQSFLNGKSRYLLRLDKEIKEIKDSGFTEYIDTYNYKSDSISNFVIGNLK